MSYYQVVTKKKPASHDRDLGGATSGFQATNVEGGDFVTAINKYACSTTMEIASTTNAAAAHNNGVFPLPLYTHSYLPLFPDLLPEFPTQATCTKTQQMFLHQIMSYSPAITLFFPLLPQYAKLLQSDKERSKTSHREWSIL